MSLHLMLFTALTLLKVYAAGSEDMDTLTFNAPILFRHLTFSEAKKQPISEINLKAALEGLDMNMSQVRFIHFLVKFLMEVICSSLTSAFFWDATTWNPSEVLVQNQR
jgi:hypothetical protein